MMLIFWIGFALVLLLLAAIRHWKGVLITCGVLWLLVQITPVPKPVPSPDDKLPLDLSTISIDVPAHLEKNDSDYYQAAAKGWPVTFGNHGAHAYSGYIWVVCTVTQTVADAAGAMVIGVRQYPYIMTGDVTLLKGSISTFFLQQAGENDIEMFENLNQCQVFGSESAATNAATEIDTKWTQVTPYGARQAGRLGMNIPYSSNVTDYKNPWNE
jgi:hypothetical protein